MRKKQLAKNGGRIASTVLLSPGEHHQISTQRYRTIILYVGGGSTDPLRCWLFPLLLKRILMTIGSAEF